ncbi:MAG: acyl-ACP thioesterase [Bacteroidetes bacterium]|nr:acyl-ACP thioesterase [Bacteroidota bacterium]MCB0843990.1 acyl-ACP thioesterase [Bacteroidota bacterium]
MALATTEPHIARFHEVDPHHRLTLPSLLNFMQETANNNSGDLGASVRDLHEEGITWVMTRMKLEIFSMPMHQEKFFVETWPAGGARSFVYRDYRLYDWKKDLIGQASSTWLVFNIHSRQMVSVPERLVPLIESPEGHTPLERATGKIRAKQPFSSGKDILVRWHDQDANGHVNNSFYFQWILESLPPKHFADKVLKEIDIIIKAECQFGDQLNTRLSQESEHVFVHEIIRKNDKKLIAQARTEWG